MTYLDEITPLQARVGWGSVGTRGSLGYEDRTVTVHGARYDRALSTHPPARLLYHLGGAASGFCAGVAINDDVDFRRSYADFAVLGDGREITSATGVWAGEPARERLACDLSGVHLLELVVATSRWDFCHAVWLDPRVDGLAPPTPRGTITDPLQRCEIELPAELAAVKRCVATVASPGWEHLLDDMLGSLLANGDCRDALLLVFLVGSSPECERVVAKYRVLPVRCRSLAPVGMASKAVLYSVARVVRAEGYLCLDCDTLVLGSLQPLFGAIAACPEGSVLACREGNSHGCATLGDALINVYDGQARDLERILGQDPGEVGEYPLPVNDGMFAGSREALLALDAAIRGMPGAAGWLAQKPRVPWRNQFLFNLALARRRCGIEADERYNVQLHASNVDVESVAGRPRVTWQGRPVRILHASGPGRDRCPQLRGLYASVPDPLVGLGQGDGYRAFLTSLWAWLGRHGIAGLTLSFYTSRDDVYARARDPSVLPVLALLHYLVRASGCTRVLETGTASGVSAACLASAVAHRPGACVVSFDPLQIPEREELWSGLPERMRACIEPRPVDSLHGMRAALAAGESYDAALLDSLHTEEQLSCELALAAQLVCPGGPILVHDWRAIPDVNRVLLAAEAAGHGVARLLARDGAEDSGLGLAIVENRRPA